MAPVFPTTATPADHTDHLQAIYGDFDDFITTCQCISNEEDAQPTHQRTTHQPTAHPAVCRAVERLLLRRGEATEPRERPRHPPDERAVGIWGVRDVGLRDAWRCRPADPLLTGQPEYAHY